MLSINLAVNIRHIWQLSLMRTLQAISKTSYAQTLLFRFVVDLLYNLLRNKFTKNRTSGVGILIISIVCIFCCLLPFVANRLSLNVERCTDRMDRKSVSVSSVTNSLRSLITDLLVSDKTSRFSYAADRLDSFILLRLTESLSGSGRLGWYRRGALHV